MSKRHRSPNDNPIQDFKDMLDHRYDPGYWTTEWVTKGRLDPFRKSIQEAHLSSFYRALALFGLIGPILVGVFVSLRFDLPRAWLWCTLTLAALFLGLWYLIHKSMIRNNVDADDPADKQPPRKQR
jgi:hypothetical protein